jgi:gas vesicle protein
MNSTSAPEAPEPHDASVARADETIAHAYEQIVSADEQLTRLSEQVARMEREAARIASAEAGLSSPPGKPALRALVALPLAACIVVAALVLLSSYGGGAKLVVARWAQQLVSTPSSPAEKPTLLAQPAPSVVQVAAAEAAPPQATSVAPGAPQDTAPTAPAGSPDHTELLQTMARNLANLERSIEQLKTTQQQMASDSSKEIAELKASQEEMKRVLAKVSEQNPSKTSPPPTQPSPALRKLERPAASPRARARSRIQREWIYDDYW